MSNAQTQARQKEQFRYGRPAPGFASEEERLIAEEKAKRYDEGKAPTPPLIEQPQNKPPSQTEAAEYWQFVSMGRFMKRFPIHQDPDSGTMTSKDLKTLDEYISIGGRGLTVTRAKGPRWKREPLYSGAVQFANKTEFAFALYKVARKTGLL